MLLLPLHFACAQPEAYNHPELHWLVHETEHFKIFYHDGAERTARELAQIAEEIYLPITTLHNYRPDSKTTLIVHDHDDYSNGGAYYYDNKIQIWATALDFELRGTHHWLRNVLTHEFSHICQLGASRKGPRWLPAIYLQWIEYEEEKRPDVLYGYPNVLASYPLPGTIIPPWFAEGCAQFQSPGLGYDHWDSHRDMLLRMRTLEGKLLTYTEMGYYDKTSLDAESVYNLGFSLVRYIADRWGEEKLHELSNYMRRWNSMTFDAAIKKHLGLSGEQLYGEWANHLRQTYENETAAIQASQRSGRLIEDEGFANLHPVFSPDGRHIAFTSNKGSDYFFTSGLYYYDLDRDTLKLLTGGVGSQLSFSPDGRFLFYDKQFGPGKHGSHFDDLAAWDLHAEKEIRLTKGRRAAQVDISADGSKLCFVVTADGTQNLWVADLPAEWWSGKVTLANERALTHHNQGEQVYSPRWSPDGSRIAFAFSRDRNRDIAVLDLATEEITPLLTSPADERSPIWADQNQIYFASDATGIFNIYRAFTNDPAAAAPVTNVLGGAFMPALSRDGRRLAYAEYHATGYKLALMDSLSEIPVEQLAYIPQYQDSLPSPTYSSDPAPELSAANYKPSFDRTFVFPRLSMDFGTFKPGLYFYFQDILEQMNAFGGFAMNSRKDRDLFALLEYKKFPPTVFMEAYNVVRHTSETFEDPFVIVGESGEGQNAVPIYDTYSIDYSFNLLQVDGGLRWKLKDEIGLQVTGIISRYRTNLTLDDGTVFGYTYFKGKAVEAQLTADYRALGRHQDICPTGGYYLQAKAAREYNDFIAGFQINAERGTLQEVYIPYDYNRFQVLGDKYLKSPLNSAQGITLTADLGFIDKDVDGFFHLYAGGLDGMKGYSFYSLGGTRKAIGRAVYTLPIWRDIAGHFWIWSLDKIYLHAYGDVGNAWVGDPNPKTWSKNLKKDGGLGLKVQFFSFTTFPTALSIDAAYGFDKFKVNDRNGVHEYGQEWRFYLTMLFSFNLRQSFMPRGRL